MPGDIAVDLTSDYQMAKLSRLKEWLYRKQTQGRVADKPGASRTKRGSNREKGDNSILYLHFFSSFKISSNGFSGNESSNPSSKSFIIPT